MAVAAKCGQVFQFNAMGGPCALCLAAPDGSPRPDQIAVAAQAAILEVRRIEAKYSRYLPDSVVSRINAGAGGADVLRLDPETAQLLYYAAHLHAVSDGLFDLTSGVLRRAWNFRQPALPEPGLLEALSGLVGWSQVEWDGDAIRLPRAGMELDLGGLGKEYAVDRVATLLTDQGISHGYVNFGGDMRVLGPRPDGSPWSLGLQHPRQPDGTLAQLALAAGALATSGDYERYFELDGVRYCHLLNPKTGYPVRYWQSVSVVAPICSAAGALCTIAMLKEAHGLGFLQRQAQAFLVVDEHGSVTCQNGSSQSSFQPLDL